jgi:spore maturation protein SpmA
MGLCWWVVVVVVVVVAAMARGNAHDVSTSISNDDEMRGA